MGAARIIACAFTEVKEGIKSHDQLRKLDDVGDYASFLDICLDAKSVYDLVANADVRRPAGKSFTHVLGQMREHMFTLRIRNLYWRTV